jgi:hypothetical protein
LEHSNFRLKDSLEQHQPPRGVATARLSCQIETERMRLAQRFQLCYCVRVHGKSTKLVIKYSSDPGNTDMQRVSIEQAANQLPHSLGSALSGPLFHSHRSHYELLHSANSCFYCAGSWLVLDSLSSHRSYRWGRIVRI